jgi:exonuclease SbcC
LRAAIQELEAKQAGFEALKERAANAEQAHTAAAEGHQGYLAAEAEAARLAAARAEEALAAGQLEQGRREADAARSACDAAIAAYSRAAHDQAKAALEESVGRLRALERDLQRDEERLTEARARAAQLRVAQEEERAHEQRHAQLTAQRDLLEHLRKVLRDAGPRVAEHLVLAVNLRAQQIYTALSPLDPGSLDWQTDYELRVKTASGERRFATLSGGQKVKAALALQLALVQQFSQAGICIFDEPTYALDADSRGRLAEAIVEAQRISGFEQLFLVSHDDAFDELAEHTVWLAYSPATGTHVA